MLQYHETPFQEIQDRHVGAAGVQLIVKREDLNHRWVSGNKWWKLKYNLEEAVASGSSTLATYGGAFSNHLVATAAAAKEIGMKSIGIIRGEETLPLNPVLSFAGANGMELFYISRSAYRTKSDEDIYLKRFNNYYLIPEGGSNLLAIKGVKEFARSLDVDFQYICCPVGTGGTLAGLIEGLPAAKCIVGFPVLKGAQFLLDDIKNLSMNSREKSNWHLMFDYHFGGYAKSTARLTAFLDEFNSLHSIPLDKIYTGKMMAGVYDLMSKGFFERGTKILVLHTGGLQCSQMHVDSACL
jgi:1-aminocyclopropane-1-carboxylate deaminase